MEAGNIMKGAAIGGAAAGVLNVVLYLIGGAVGAEFLMMQPGATEPSAIPVAVPFIMSLVPGLIGGGVLVALNKFAAEKAWTIFLGVSVLAFLGMFPAPIMQMSDDTTAIIFLELMHVVEAVAVVVGISKFARG